MTFHLLAIPELPAFAGALLFVIVARVAYKWLNRNPLPYPPGPRPKFLIGNALDFPKSIPSRVFAEWGKKYNSDIVHATAFGSHVVVINSFKLAEELLEKRAQLYSDRPTIPIVDIMGWSESGTELLKYGDVWRQHRRLCWQNFHPEAARQYHSTHHERVHFFLHNVLHDPESIFEHIKLLTISLPMSMMYGYVPESLDDPVIRLNDEVVELAMPLFDQGGTLINFFPMLRHIPSWIPGATAKRVAEKVRDMAKETKRIPLERVTSQMKAGTAAPSFLADFLERKAAVGASEAEEAAVYNIAWSVYGAASDTSMSATSTFLYLMAKHPHVQKKAQEEIDRVIGFDRLPVINDRPELPYIEAVYREVLRYEPPASLGLPHALVKDDVVNGNFIPKGTTVVANIWAMTHDETLYPDPFAFKPERYFDENGKLNEDRVLAFGFGRRICVGKAVATDSLWLIIASCLACFKTGKAKDESGNDIEINDIYTDNGITIHKKPFKCAITPRSCKITELIESACNSSITS